MSGCRSHNDGTNLIINYLPQTVDEDELSAMFAECGMIESVKIIRDGKSQISRGFAFLKYVDKDAADRAMKQFAGFKMGQKTLRVSLSRPAGEETRDTNTIIENLPEDMDDDQLYEQFSVYGQIITHRVCRDPQGRSKCRGYIRYDLKSEAEDAITGMHGIYLGGSEDLVVRFADPPVVRATPELLCKKTSRSAGHPYPPHAMRPVSRPLYAEQQHHTAPYRGGARPVRGAARPVRGIARPVRGKPESHRGMVVPREKLMHIKDTPLETWSSIHGAEGMDDIEDPAGPGEVDLTYVAANHKSSFDPEKGWCVFVYNLPQNAANETLYQLFCRFGAINTVKPVVDENGLCRGFGFVHMMNYEDACRSIEVLDGTPYKGKTLQVRFKNAKK